MPLNLAEKQELVASTKDTLKDTSSIVVLDYSGITVSEITDFRSTARESNVKLAVVPNTLVRRAIEGTEFECMKDALIGQNMIAFSFDEPSAAARVVRDAKKKIQNLDVRGVAIASKWLPPEQLDSVANLPTKDAAVAQLMSVLLAPVTKLAQTLNAVPTKLVRTLDALRAQKSGDS